MTLSVKVKKSLKKSNRLSNVIAALEEKKLKLK